MSIGSGKDRTLPRERHRRTIVVAAATTLVALPFALHFGGGAYVRGGGTALTPWLPLAFWLAEIAIIIGACRTIYKLSDEFERRTLTIGTAWSGATMALLLPPVFFIGGYAGLGADAFLMVWLLAIGVGCGVSTFCRSRA